MPLNAKRKTARGQEGLLPNGVYRVVIEAVDEKLGPSGHNYYNIRLRPIINGSKGQQAIWDKISHSPDARFRVDAFLDALEVEDVDEDLPKEWFVGKSFWASVTSREYEGKWSNEIKQYLTPEAAESLLQKQAEADGSSEAVLVSTQRKTRPVPEVAAPVASKAKAGKAAELSREDSPF